MPSHPYFQGMCLLLQEESLGSASHCSLAPDRWLEPCVNLNRILLGRHNLQRMEVCFLPGFVFKIILEVEILYQRRVLVVSVEAYGYNGLLVQ